jgi:hypothetical protein
VNNEKTGYWFKSVACFFVYLYSTGFAVKIPSANFIKTSASLEQSQQSDFDY